MKVFVPAFCTTNEIFENHPRLTQQSLCMDKWSYRFCLLHTQASHTTLTFRKYMGYAQNNIQAKKNQISHLDLPGGPKIIVLKNYWSGKKHTITN